MRYWLTKHLPMLVEERKSALAMWLAWKLPRRVAYWCALRVAANATQGRYSSQVVPELTAVDALSRWEWKP